MRVRGSRIRRHGGGCRRDRGGRRDGWLGRSRPSRRGGPQRATAGSRPRLRIVRWSRLAQRSVGRLHDPYESRLGIPIGCGAAGQGPAVRTCPRDRRVLITQRLHRVVGPSRRLRGLDGARSRGMGTRRTRPVVPGGVAAHAGASVPGRGGRAAASSLRRRGHRDGIALDRRPRVARRRAGGLRGTVEQSPRACDGTRPSHIWTRFGSIRASGSRRGPACIRIVVENSRAVGVVATGRPVVQRRRGPT